MNKLLKSWFDEKKIWWERISRFSSMRSVEKREILSHWKKISSNHLFSNFFSKTIAFTKFLRKKCEREFLQFPHYAMFIDFTQKYSYLHVLYRVYPYLSIWFYFYSKLLSYNNYAYKLPLLLLVANIDLTFHKKHLLNRKRITYKLKHILRLVASALRYRVLQSKCLGEPYALK